MKKERQAAQVYNYHGFPVYYRVEHRKDGDALILSLRDEHNRMKCEDSPHRFPKAAKGDIEQALELLSLKFLMRCFAPTSKDGLARRVEYVKKGTLPFGALWHMDISALKEANGWRTSTFEKYNRQIEPLSSAFCECPLDQLTPTNCISILEKMSYQNHCQCANLLRRIFEYECSFGSFEENPWTNYQPQARRKKSKTTENLRQRELTTEQCREIMGLCQEKASLSSYGGIYLAAAFLLLTGLSFPELCALRLSDVKVLSEPKGCLAIQINHEKYLPEGAKKYKSNAIEEEYRKRILILPDFLSSLIAAHFPPMENMTEKQFQNPLIHGPKGYLQVARPDQLRRELNRTFGGICGYSEFGATISVEDRLRQTAQWNLRRVGFTEEEMRYHFGWVPQTTAAKSYNDFACASQLNRRRRIQNRWAKKVCPPPVAGESEKMTAGIKSFYPASHKLCDIRGELFLPEASTDGGTGSFSIILSAAGGMRNLFVEYIKKG